MRLNKYIAECGVCSRREADRLIDEGRVFVNGIKATLGTQVEVTDSVIVNGKELGNKNEKKVYAYYKPVGVTCTEKDKHAKVTVMDSVKLPVRVTYAGRLDKDSEGLLLLTNDGELIDKLMRGANRHEKEYVVKVQKEITEEFIKKMGQGVYLKELDTTTRPCEIHQTGKYTFQIILTQGLNRQIRRMCQTFGYEVKQLKRIRINDLALGTLKPGQYRELTVQERKKLYSGVGMLQ